MQNDKNPAANLSLQDLADIAEVSSGMPIWQDNKYTFFKNGEKLVLSKNDVVATIKSRLPLFADMEDNAFDQEKTWDTIYRVITDQIASEGKVQSTVPEQLNELVEAKVAADKLNDQETSDTKQTTRERINQALEAQAKLAKQESTTKTEGEAPTSPVPISREVALPQSPKSDSKSDSKSEPSSNREFRQATKDSLRRAEERAAARGTTALENPLAFANEQFGDSVRSVLGIGLKKTSQNSEPDAEVGRSSRGSDLSLNKPTDKSADLIARKTELQNSISDSALTNKSGQQVSDATSGIKNIVSGIAGSQTVKDVASQVSTSSQIFASKGIATVSQGAVDLAYSALNNIGNLFNNPAGLEPVFVSSNPGSSRMYYPDEAPQPSRGANRSNRSMGGPISQGSSLINKALSIRGLISTGTTAVGTAAAGVSFGTVATIAVIVVAAVFLLALILMTFFMQQFQQEGVAPDHLAPSLFTVHKTPDTTSIGNFSEAQTPTKKITYTLNFDTKGNTMSVVINDSTTAFTETGEYSETQMAVTRTVPNTDTAFSFPKTIDGGNSQISYTLNIPVNQENKDKLNNGILVNTVTVDATIVGGAKNGQTETRTAIATVQIGDPGGTAPYGFPISGNISGHVDAYDVPAISVAGGDTLPAHQHCGELPLMGGANSKLPCVEGGIDIGSSGEVKSTAKGFVIYSGFEQRHGGVVIIAAKDFIAAYLHLAENGLHPTGKVEMGDPIGSVYTLYPPAGPGLATSSGPHVHYQVLKNGNNQFFLDQNNVGSCLAGKILSQINYSQLATGSVDAGNGEGKFICN